MELDEVIAYGAACPSIRSRLALREQHPTVKPSRVFSAGSSSHCGDLERIDYWNSSSPRAHLLERVEAAASVTNLNEASPAMCIY